MTEIGLTRTCMPPADDVRYRLADVSDAEVVAALHAESGTDPRTLDIRGGEDVEA